MEILKSFCDLCVGILKRIYWLLPTLITDPFDVLERLGVYMNVPQWASWLLFYLGLAVAITLTYHELRQKNKIANENLVKQEWEYVRKRNIELVELEEYPKKLPDILKKMEINLMGILEVAKTNEVGAKELWESLKGINPKELGRVLCQHSYDDNIIVLAEYYRHMQLSKSGIKLNEDTNSEWLKIEDELESVKKDIPDLLLKDNVNAYRHALKGISYLRLFYYHLNKAPNSELKNIITDTMKPYYYPDDLLDYCLTKVANRIRELKCGEKIILVNKELPKR